MKHLWRHIAGGGTLLCCAPNWQPGYGLFFQLSWRMRAYCTTEFYKGAKDVILCVLLFGGQIPTYVFHTPINLYILQAVTET